MIQGGLYQNIRIKEGRRRRRRRIIISGIALVVIAILIFIGVQLFNKKGSASLMLPYSYQNESLSEANPDSYEVELFAKDLVTVADESQYWMDSLVAGAALSFNVTERKVVHSEQAFTRMYPASTTKLMTMLVVLKYGDLSSMVTVGEDCVTNLPAGSSLCDINAGDVISLNDLLYGLMLPSGNDAAIAIANHISGSMEAFAELMNQEARLLGATGTHFVNSHGLHDDNHYSTAYDLYLIFNELLKFDKFLEVVGTPAYTATYTDANGAPKTNTFETSNWFLNGNAIAPTGVTVLGGKTGTETLAKYCLTLCSRDNDGDIFISVVLQSESRQKLYNNMTVLLEETVK